MDALVWALTVLFIHRRGVLYPDLTTSTEEAAPDPAVPVGNFAETIARDGIWFPKGR